MADIYSRSVNTPSGISGKTESNGSVINCYSLITPVAKNDGGNDYMVILGIRYR